MENEQNISNKPSKAWYLLPIFLNIIGGVIGYFILKDRDRKFAERLLIVGLIMMVVSSILYFVMYFFVILYAFGIFSTRGVVPCSPCFSYFAFVDFKNGELTIMNGPRNIIITNVDKGVISGSNYLGPGDQIKIVSLPTYGDAEIKIDYQVVDFELSYTDTAVLHNK